MRHGAAMTLLETAITSDYDSTLASFIPGVSKIFGNALSSLSGMVER